MKKNIAAFTGILLLMMSFTFLQAQKKTMTWTTPSEKAGELASKGVAHFFNIEFAQAYNDLIGAVELDPNFTIPLVFLSNLTPGDLRKSYAARAVKSAANKTEGEKLFASLVAEGNDAAKNKATLQKLTAMFPDGSMLAGMLAFTGGGTPDEQFKAYSDYLKKFPDQAWPHNMMGYYYMQQKKDFDMAKTEFDKYISMYPDGCNPYDSMGEYYFNKGDMENSEKYYKMSLQKYPYNNSSINKLTEIGKTKEKKAAN